MDVKVIDRTMDPALKKLLDELPLENPDRMYVTVYTEHTPKRRRVPVGQRVQVELGEWSGPTTRYVEVLIDYAGRCVGRGPVELETHIIRPGELLEVGVLIML